MELDKNSSEHLPPSANLPQPSDSLFRRGLQVHSEPVLIRNVRRSEQRFQINCFLPGVVQQVPEGPGRKQHKHCDRYLL